MWYRAAMVSALLLVLSACAPRCGPANVAKSATLSAPSPSQSSSPSETSSPSQSPSTSPSSTPARSVSQSPPPTPGASTSPSSSPSTSPSTSPSPSPSPTPPPLVAGATPPFHAGEVALAYNPVAMSATGGVQPYTWSVGAGALPDGLSLGSDGQVAGTPTRAGPFSFTVVVADSAGSKASLNASVSIAAALTAGFGHVCSSGGKCSVEQGCSSVCGGFGNQAGGAAPYSYHHTGPLPPGTAVGGLALTGKFSATGNYTFTVTITDGFGATASISPTFMVFPHIAFAGGTVNCFYAGCGQTSGFPPATLPYSGGSGTPAVRINSWAFTCSYPPCGPIPAPTVSANGGSLFITVAGSTGGSGYTGVLKLTLSDRDFCGPGSYCSVSGVVNVVVQSG